MKFDKGKVGIIGSIGLGVVISPVLKRYWDIPVPYVGQYLPNGFKTTSTFIPIVAGATAFGLSFYGKLWKGKNKENVKDMLMAFGFTALISGVVNGALNMGLGARFAGNNMAVRRPTAYAPQPVRAFTPTGIVSSVINS